MHLDKSSESLTAHCAMCISWIMKYGFIRKMSRLTLATQRAAMETEGVHEFNTWTHHHEGQSLEECLDTIPIKSTLVVYDLLVLAAPKNRQDRPRNALRRSLRVLAEGGGTIIETSTGSRFKPQIDCLETIMNAVDRQSRAAGSGMPGRRKSIILSEKDEARMKTLWTAGKYATDPVACEAMGPGWNVWKARRYFGPSGRPWAKKQKR